MIQLKSMEQMAKAIARARRMKPFVRMRGFRQYEVKSSDSQAIYTVHFRKQDGKRFGECNCKGGERGFICYHLAGAVAVHIAVASMRRAA
jgi:hypothetical protein